MTPFKGTISWQPFLSITDDELQVLRQLYQQQPAPDQLEPEAGLQVPVQECRGLVRLQPQRLSKVGVSILCKE